MENEIKIGDVVKTKSVQELIDTNRYTVQNAEIIGNKLFVVEDTTTFNPNEGLTFILKFLDGQDGKVFCNREDFDIYRESKPVTDSIKNDRRITRLEWSFCPGMSWRK
jgi:hypothetical protein